MNEKILMKHHFLKKKIIATKNMKDIADTDYIYIEKVRKSFEIKILGKYQDSYLKNDILPLADAL